MKRRIAVLLLLWFALLSAAARGETPLRFGVLGIRSTATTFAKWQPLATYLETALGRRVVLSVYGLPELSAAVAQGKVDVVLTNPGHSVLLRNRFGLSAPLATMIVEESGKELSSFGGLIVARANASWINSLADLGGKKIATAGIESFGGYQMQAGEMLEAGISVPDKSRLLVTGMPHDKALEAVLAGQADAGFVRTGVLEAMAREGRIDIRSIKIINRQNLPSLPLASSTRLYPEWPVAVMPGFDDHFARLLSIALLSLPPDSAAAHAAGIHGFDIAADYSGVEQLLRRLRLPPFDVPPEITLHDLWHKYFEWITALGILLLLLAATGAGLVMLNRRARNSEERYRALIENSPIGIGVHRAGKIIYVNSAALAILGAGSSSELIGKPMIERVHPDFRAMVRERIAAVETAGDELSMQEEKFIRLDGSVIDVQIQGTPIQYEGTPAIQVSFMDISERKRAEQALRESEGRLALVTEAAAAGVWDVYPQLNRSYFSSRFWQLLGYSRVEAQGAEFSFAERLHPDDRERALTAQERILREGGRFDETYRLRCSDDGYRWFRGLGLGEKDEAGQVVRFIGAISDITGLKDAEEALRLREERWKSALDGVGDAVWDWDIARGKFEFSRRGKEMLGYDDAEIGDDSEQWLSRVHPDDKEHLLVALRGVRAGGPGTYASEHRMRCRDDSWKWVLGRGIVIARDDEGMPLRAIGTLVDVSERKQAEAERSELEAQLRESQKLEAVGTLAGGIAHDFNNILAAILGNTALATKDVRAGDVVSATVSLKEIDKAAGRARNLVQQILAFSRKQAQHFENQPLRPLIEDALQLLRATLPAGVNIAATLADDPIYAEVDATQIEQVVINLCTNAWHAIEGKAGRIKVELLEVAFCDDGPLPMGMAGPGRYALIRVTDNGCGMDAETLARIFEPFYTTKPVDKGTGLGLAVVHGIVKSHRGTIAVDTQPDGGTTFDVYLPAAVAAEPGDPVAEAVPDTTAGQGKRVLYVDDDEAMVFLVTRMLEDRGYRVSGFEDGDAALDAVREAPGDFDLVVTDFNMPGLSGLDVARELRVIRPELPVVITTGYITDELTAGAEAAGVREVVYKPNTVEDLCAVIRTLVDEIDT